MRMMNIKAKCSEFLSCCVIPGYLRGLIGKIFKRKTARVNDNVQLVLMTGSEGLLVGCVVD